MSEAARRELPERLAHVAGREPDRDPAGALARDLRQCASGDHDAFARVYDATSARSFGLAVRVLRDRARAEDAVQEAYLQIWRQAARFDVDRGSALSWILMIVHGTAVNEVRSSQARANREDLHEQRDAPLQVGREDPTADAASAILDARRVRAALEQLTELQRTAIELAYFEGCTHAEVAGRVGIPLGTAKTRIRDGLLRLRDTMAG